jgi:hypothetical protein
MFNCCHNFRGSRLLVSKLYMFWPCNMGQAFSILEFYILIKNQRNFNKDF